MTAVAPNVLDILATITGRAPDSIRSDDRLADLGVDSLDRVLLAVLCEERCGRKLPDHVLVGLRTVADVDVALTGQEDDLVPAVL